MGYRSDVRIIVTKTGFEELNTYVRNYCSQIDDSFNWLEYLNVKEITKKGNILFGWDDIKWYEDDDESVRAIMKGLQYVNSLGFAYSYARIGDYLEDSENIHKEGEFQEDVEWIFVNRSFEVDKV